MLSEKAETVLIGSLINVYNLEPQPEKEKSVSITSDMLVSVSVTTLVTKQCECLACEESEASCYAFRSIINS